MHRSGGYGQNDGSIPAGLNISSNSTLEIKLMINWKKISRAGVKLITGALVMERNYLHQHLMSLYPDTNALKFKNVSLSSSLRQINYSYGWAAVWLVCLHPVATSLFCPAPPVVWQATAYLLMPRMTLNVSFSSGWLSSASDAYVGCQENGILYNV